MIIKKLKMILLSGFLFAGPIDISAAEKHVNLILINTQNVTDQKYYDYLEASITEALRAELKKVVAFREYPSEKLKKLAEQNFIYEKDLHTKTAAINLGLLASQDIVINGHYDVETTRSGNQILNGNLYVYDIAKQKEVLKFDYKFNLDSGMFEHINDMSEDAAQAMLKVLPNREAWERSGLAAFLDPNNRIFWLMSGAGVSVQSPSADNILKANRYISQTDLPVQFILQFEYLHYGFFDRQYFIGASVNFGYATGSYETEIQGSEVPAEILQFEGGIKGGYRFLIGGRLHLLTALGIGYSYARTDLNFSNSNLIAISTTNQQSVDSASFSGTAPFILPSVRLSFRLTPRIEMAVDAGYKTTFFSDTTSGSLLFLLGAGYAI